MHYNFETTAQVDETGLWLVGEIEAGRVDDSEGAQKVLAKLRQDWHELNVRERTAAAQASHAEVTRLRAALESALVVEKLDSDLRRAALETRRNYLHASGACKLNADHWGTCETRELSQVEQLAEYRASH